MLTPTNRVKQTLFYVPLPDSLRRKALAAVSMNVYVNLKPYM